MTRPPRHARPRRPSPLRIAAAVTMVIVAGAVAARAETWWPVAGPFIQEGSGADRIDVDPVWVTVHDVTAATAVTGTYDDVVDTDGAWLLVDVTFEAQDEPSTVSEVAVRDAAGREFRQSDRVDNPMIGGTLDPGLPERGHVVLEVPADALGDLVVVVSPNSPGRLIPRAVAEITIRVDTPATDPVDLRARELVTP